MLQQFSREIHADFQTFLRDIALLRLLSSRTSFEITEIQNNSAKCWVSSVRSEKMKMKKENGQSMIQNRDASLIKSLYERRILTKQIVCKLRCLPSMFIKLRWILQNNFKCAKRLQTFFKMRRIYDWNDRRVYEVRIFLTRVASVQAPAPRLQAPPVMPNTCGIWIAQRRTKENSARRWTLR